MNLKQREIVLEILMTEAFNVPDVVLHIKALQRVNGKESS